MVIKVGKREKWKDLYLVPNVTQVYSDFVSTSKHQSVVLHYF